MRHFVCKRYAHHRGLAAGLVLILLTFAFVCLVMVPTMDSSNQQSCQSLTCWLLISVPLLAVAIVSTRFLWTTGFTLLREHGLRLFRPPRPYQPQFLEFS
jgi:isoprenylcysteine carboxyl methyltransferase (ICMT) family protein YpbQ